MALQGVVALAGIRIPDFGSTIERPRHDFVSIRIIESHRIYDILVLLKRKQFGTSLGVPDLAGSIVTSGDKLLSRLVECAICQGQQMRSQFSEHAKLLILVFKLFLDKLFYELLQLRFPRLRNQGLF